VKGTPPNKRLKLAGALVGRIAFPRWLAFLSAAPPPCARRALRPQLKRDPLGSYRSSCASLDCTTFSAAPTNSGVRPLSDAVRLGVGR
jgi:hypothetical protein